MRLAIVKPQGLVKPDLHYPLTKANIFECSQNFMSKTIELCLWDKLRETPSHPHWPNQAEALHEFICEVPV